MQQLRIESELSQQESFKPQINKRSEKIAQVKHLNEYQSGSVTDRLYHDAANRLEKQSRTSSVRMASAKPVDEQTQYPFKPAICSTSKALTDNNSLYQGSFKNFE